MKIQTSAKLKTFLMRFISAVAILFFMSQPGMAQTEEKIDFLKEGDFIPQFNIPLENGTTISSSDLKGKVVVLSFFATWCGPCMKELPHVQKEIWEKYKDNNKFQLLVIGREHTREEMTKFKNDKGFTFPIIADTKREIFSIFAKQNIPRMYLIDKTGKIVYMTEGFEDKTFKSFLSKMDTELKK